MTTIPSPPTFAGNDSSLANLQALAACSRFLVETGPAWHFCNDVATSIPAGTPTMMPMRAITDNDGLYTSPGFATIQTRGYYKCDLSLPVGASYTVRAYLLLTTAPTGNPRGAGVTTPFAMQASYASSVALTLNGSDMTPYCCYPGDTIKLYCWSAGANAQVVNSAGYGTATRAASGTLYASFTGRYLSYGT